MRQKMFQGMFDTIINFTEPWIGILVGWHTLCRWETSDIIHGVSWPSGLAYRTQVLVLAAECGFESRP